MWETDLIGDWYKGEQGMLGCPEEAVASPDLGNFGGVQLFMQH